MDRKAWIVIALCCLGLVLNFNISRKNAEALREKEREALVEEEAAGVKEGEQAAATVPAASGEESAGAESSAGATEAPETAPVVQEQTFTLSSRGAVFTFTNFGGGIKGAEMNGCPAILESFIAQTPKIVMIELSRLCSLTRSEEEILISSR